MVKISKTSRTAKATAPTEQSIKRTLRIGVIEDMMNNLKRIIDDDNNAAAMYNLGILMQNAFKMPMYFTGIGKPSYIAKKQAATLKSIMCNSEFIDACLAGHGDLGSIPMHTPSMLYAISKSGCTKELFDLFKVLKQLRPKCTIVIVCMSTDEQEAIVQACEDIDFVIRFNFDFTELDGFGIVPATSNAMFEILFANALNNAIYEAVGPVEVCKALQRSHPSGTLYNKVTKLLEELEAEQDTQQDDNVTEATSKQDED